MKKLSAEEFELQRDLLSSFFLFTRVFFEKRTGREFDIGKPVSRESHVITICKALTRVLTGETNRLIINVPPRYGKTELVIHFIAWAFAHYPDSNFLYTSYAHSLARKQTKIIRQILNMPLYRHLFGIEINSDSSAADDFETIQDGSVYAAGSGGAITGRGAGVRGVDRFGGAIIIDDIHKPEDIFSEKIRKSENEWFYSTLLSRLNDPQKTPIILIAQRLHEDDLPGNLTRTGEWETVVLPALDSVGNALDESRHTAPQLEKMKIESRYVFASQMQQNPQAKGTGVFLEKDFPLLENNPKILKTFITVDAAESTKKENDYSVFSFWGVYEIESNGIKTGLIGLHWLDCYEKRIEPRHIESEFTAFWMRCMAHEVKPQLALIETKSAGTTLASHLQDQPGITVWGINRTKFTESNSYSGNKSQRFIRCQPYVAARQVTLPKFSLHSEKCIEHMNKITFNNSHANDDIADTAADAIQAALIDKTIWQPDSNESNEVLDKIMSANARRYGVIEKSHGSTWQ